MSIARNVRILKAENALNVAEKRFAEIVGVEQARCAHAVVIARPGGNPFRYLDTYWQEMRVCPACGLREEGDWGKFKVLKTEAVIMKDFQYNIYCHEVRP